MAEGESSIVSEILEKVSINAGQACLKYINKSKLQERVSMLKGNESDNTIIENLSSEMIIDAMSKMDEASEKDNSDPMQLLGACAPPNNHRVITQMDYLSDDNFSDDPELFLQKFERANSLPRRKEPKQLKKTRKTPSFISPVHKNRQSEYLLVNPSEIIEIASDSSDSDEKNIDDFVNEINKKNSSNVNSKNGACAEPKNQSVIKQMDYLSEDNFSDDPELFLQYFERANSLPRRKEPKQQRLIRKMPSFVSPVHKKRKSGYVKVTPSEIIDMSGDSSDSDESFIDNFINDFNKKKSSDVNSENGPSKFDFDSFTSSKSTSSTDGNWVRSHSKALYAIFPEHDKIELRRRCRNLNQDEIRFADLIKEIASGVENYDEYQSELQLALLLSKEENENVKEEPQIVFIGCGICFGDYELDEMLTCTGNDAHMFCSECLRNYSRVQVEGSNYDIKCLDPFCTSLYSLTVLYNVLEPKMFNIMMDKKQEMEIDAAGIENLESCPFCPFALEFDVKATIATEDPVLLCANPTCGKISCRLCKKQDHRPDKCEENDAQTRARTLLENEATSAMIRTCHQCGKSFVRNTGCNHMTCSCGAQMCYICKQPYNLCRKTGACGQNVNDDTLHQNEVRARVQEVRATIDPNLLLYDPTATMT